MTQWTITVDHMADPTCKVPSNENAVGMVGPDCAEMTAEEICKDPKSIPFRMYDDDGTLYYEGFLVGCDEFAPLDDFGEQNAGCTRIDLFEDGEWNTL